MIRATFVCRWALLACVCLAALGTAHAQSLYGKRIYLDTTATDHAKDTAKVLAHWLKQMTGSEFAVMNEAGKQGIHLVLANGQTLPTVGVKALQETQNSEAFLLYSADVNQLWIVGNSDQGLRHGMYWYLDKLGCRWLLPSDRWTIIPPRNSIQVKVNTVQAPAFLNRGFFGTGGFGRPSIDPKQEYAKRWDLYKEQNLFGITIHLGGHVGEAFNARYKKELTEHPEYLAEIDGKRQPWGVITKLCYSNPGLQELFVNDRLKDLKAAIARNPATMAVSVEPADGGGHCDCAECRKLGSVSDRVFTLANLVAKAVAKECPGRYVNLYAYNDHAAVPKIPLEPNMIISLAPYAFQRTGMTAEEMIKAWGGKHNFLGMYSYWCIPDWARCLPDLDYRTIPGLIRFWHEQHIRSYTAESTYCGGNMGLGWYLAARLCWDPSQDEKAIVDDYFTKAFGEAKAPMRRMLDRWANGFMLTDHELGLCYRDLREAYALTKDPAVRGRLADMGRYVQYLRLYYEYTNAKGEKKVAAAKALVTFLWRTYESGMVQTFRMAQLINRDMTPKDQPSQIDDVNPNAEIWKTITPVTDEELAPLLADGAAKYVPLTFTPRKFATEALTPLANPAEKMQENVYTAPVRLSNTMHFGFTVQDGVRQVTFKLRLVKRATARVGSVLVEDPTHQTLLQRGDIPADGNWYDVTAPIEKNGRYNMTLDGLEYDLFIPQEVRIKPYLTTGTFAGTTRFAFAVQDRETKEVTFKFMLNNRPGQSDKITVTGPDGNTVYFKEVPATGQWQYLTIPVATTGIYRMTIVDQKITFRLLVPADLSFAVVGSYTATAQCPPTFFYVPKGQQNVAIYSTGVIPIVITNPEGKKVTVERNEQGQALFLLEIPAGMDGKAWSFSMYKSWSSIQLLNAPNIFSFSPDSLLLPAELAEPAVAPKK